ncbi:MAG: TonB-dependent receptor [Bacteroidetes bacterium]|nr:TonB-dependent receptor [Bacteroidota bacterium]
MKTIHISLFCLLIVATTLYAGEAPEQVQNIRGKVLDAITTQPLPGAHVRLLGETAIATTTDLNGLFVLRAVQAGRQSIEVSYVGYAPQIVRNLLVTGGKEVVVEVLLHEAPVSLGEITVSSAKPKEQTINDMALVSARAFTVEETERFAGSLGDPARMVANYAGVMTQNDSRNDIIIRGNSPSGVLWRMEGIEIPNPNHFGSLGTTGGPVSMVNNNLLMNSDFLTGAFPAEYGNALAGVFDLNLRSGNPAKNEFLGQIGFNGFELGAEGPVFGTGNGQKASYLANFRYSTLELMNELGFDVGTGSAVPRYKDLTFVMDVPGTKYGRFKVIGLWGQSLIRLGRDLSDTAANQYNFRGTATDFGSGLGVVGLTHTWFPSAKTRLRSTLSWQRTYSEAILDSVVTDAFKPFYRGYEKESKLSFNTQLRGKLGANASYLAGLNVDVFGLDYVDSVFSKRYQQFITRSDVQGRMMLYRAYGQLHQNFGQRLSANAGMNFQYAAINQQLVAEPRIGLNYRLNETAVLTAGAGLHSQLQPRSVYFSQAYLPQSGTYIRTNEDLKLTRSLHQVIGFQQLLGEGFRFKTEAYYQYLFDAPVKPDFPEFSMLNFGDQFGTPRIDSLVNKGKGQNYGLELTVEKFLSKGWYMLFTASVFDSKYTGYDGIWRNTAFNGNYVFNLLGGYELKLNEKLTLTLDGKFVWAGGRRTVPVDFVASAQKGEEVRDWSRAYEEKYDDYIRSDFRIGLKSNGKKLWQEWAIDLQNITGNRSIFMEAYDPRKNELYYVYQQGFVPMFLYRVRF